MISFEYCWKHNLLRPAGDQCARCAAAASQRDVISVLEARIADLEAECLDLRRRVTNLEHAYTVLGDRYERLANQPGEMLL
jgi:hypothetical protein